MKVEYINPFINSVVQVFETSCGCSIKRGAPKVLKHFQPQFEISGMIGLSGRWSGTVIVSVDRGVAIAATEAMLGQKPDGIDDDVIDAVGEITNMIAGSAKRQLEQLSMSLALPAVITGKNHVIKFESGVHPICVPFECAWGPMSLEVGLVETPAAVTV